MPNIFEEVRNGVTIAQAIEYLGLQATETKGEQLRFGCPKCGGSDRRTLSVNLQKGFRCFSGDKKGDDATALVAHCLGIRNGEAAQLLKDRFLHSATKPEPARAKAEGRGEDSDVLAPLELETEHPLLELLGLTPAIMEAIGGGYSSKGTMAGRICLPLRTPDGTLVGYEGIATKPDMQPLLKFPPNLEARCRPQPKEQDEMRKLLRIVS